MNKKSSSRHQLNTPQKLSHNTDDHEYIRRPWLLQNHKRKRVHGKIKPRPRVAVLGRVPAPV